MTIFGEISRAAAPFTKRLHLPPEGNSSAQKKVSGLSTLGLLAPDLLRMTGLSLFRGETLAVYAWNLIPA